MNTLTGSTVRRRSRRIWWLLPVGTMAAAAGLAGTQARSASPPPANDGLVCTTNHTGPNASSFTLTARSGEITTAEGNRIPMWGYAGTTGRYQYPSPFLCVTQGDTVTVILRNELKTSTGAGVRTSIAFDGMTGVTADGDPAGPEFTAGGKLTSLTSSVASGDSITYTFVADKPGSYLYESGTNAVEQVQMGLFGGLVVRSNTAPAQAGDSVAYSTTGPNGSEYQTDREFAQMLSDVDPDMHHALDESRAFDITRYRPRYWFINGRMFPDTIAPNDAEWLPDQPYSGLVRMRPYDADETKAGYDHAPVLVRYFNASGVAHPYHPHAADTRMIGVDGRELRNAGGGDLSVPRFLVNIAPGQTVDALYQWKNVEQWAPVSNPIPVPLPDFRDLRYTVGATWYSGTPYLGVQDDLPIGTTGNNQCGEYYHVAHSHALNEATTFGAAMGGMLTLYRIDPPTGCP